MEAKDVEKTVIAKPVPSRPTHSNFRSFSELLAGAIKSPPSNVGYDETGVTAIKPKTLRFIPVANHAPFVTVSSQAEVSGSPTSCTYGKVDNVLSSDSVIYKPLAKVASKTVISALATTAGNSNISDQQALTQVQACLPFTNQLKYNERSDLSPNLDQNFLSQSEREEATETSKMAQESKREEQKSTPPTNNVDRPSYDGYNWRKYGQKQVKGSEYPRSYYKCTNPNCPVKKKVERSIDGQIAEIVYEGEHNHARPHPPKSRQGHGFVSDGNGQESKKPSWGNQISEKNECSEGRIEHSKDIGLSPHPINPGKAPLSYEPFGLGEINGGLGITEYSAGLRGKFEDRSTGLEAKHEELRSKRRKKENEPSITMEGVQETGATVQNSTNPEIMGDGFRWRKYGQKVVKGSPYPRSYYRCTNVKCTMRKYVEKAGDSKAYITTYEGKHNHDMTMTNTNPLSQSSRPDTQGATSEDKL